MIAIYILFLLLETCFVIFFLYMSIASMTGAPFVPSNRKTAEAMIELADIKKGNTIYDLGSGNGKLLLLATKKGAHAIGYEINPMLVLLSNLRGAKTYWKNFWKANIRDADVIFVYLLPWKMDRLAKKLKEELKPGTLIVSNSFIFPRWKILRQDLINHVYVFRV
jgi:ribosomal protein L11 methylase PrmA